MESIVNLDLFINRHLGLSDFDEQKMLSKLGFNNIDQFINQVIPEDIQLKEKSLEILPQGCSEIGLIKTCASGSIHAVTVISALCAWDIKNVGSYNSPFLPGNCNNIPKTSS